VENVYRMVPASHDFRAGTSYAARMSFAGATHDDDNDPNLGLDLDTTADVLSQLENALDPTQSS
jgi:hypothetical protein